MGQRLPVSEGRYFKWKFTLCWAQEFKNFKMRSIARMAAESPVLSSRSGADPAKVSYFTFQPAGLQDQTSPGPPFLNVACGSNNPH